MEPGTWEPGLNVETEMPASEFLAKLDAASGDHPVVLRDFSNHDVLLNSKAMELTALTDEELAGFGDLVVRDENGALSGFFLESAAEVSQALSTAIGIPTAHGITGVKESYSDQPEIDAYVALAEAGELPVHAALSVIWHTGTDKAAYQALVKTGETVEGVDTRFAKIVVDGIPPTKTAAFLEPYLPVEDNVIGALDLTTEELTQAVIWLDSLGVSVQTHSVGDRAVRVTLDAIQAARETNGDSGVQHDIAHACLVDEADLPQFKELGVAANFSPMFRYPSPLADGLSETLLGAERMTDYCPALTLQAANAHLTAGSDWPVVSSADPWAGIETLVTRQAPDGSRPGQVLAEAERVSLEQALVIFTINGARALRLGDVTGSIEVGKSADLVVLDQDIFSVAPEKISDTKVLETLFKGKTVYSAEEKAMTEAVTAVAEAYARDTYTADIDLLKSIFHADAIMVGELPSGPVFTTPKAFFNDLSSRPSMEEAGDLCTSKIEYVDVAGNVASVTLSESGFFGTLDFVNYLNMMNQDGKWLITSKTFSVK